MNPHVRRFLYIFALVMLGDCVGATVEHFRHPAHVEECKQ